MTGARIIRDVFGTLPDGRAVERVVLRGDRWLRGAHHHLRRCIAGADRAGPSTAAATTSCSAMTIWPAMSDKRKFFGASVGRYANRIAHGRFVLDGETIQLNVNNGPNALHGGPDGFDRKLWQILEIDEGEQPAVTLALCQPGRRGELSRPARRATDLPARPVRPSCRSAFEARTDRPTVVNLTNHSFFNLEGLAAQDGHSRPSI